MRLDSAFLNRFSAPLNGIVNPMSVVPISKMKDIHSKINFLKIGFIISKIYRPKYLTYIFLTH